MSVKKYFDIEEFKTVDELLDHAESMDGPGTFVLIGRMKKRNIGAFGQEVAANGERVLWPGETENNHGESRLVKRKRALKA